MILFIILSSFLKINKSKWQLQNFQKIIFHIKISFIIQ